MRMIEMISSGFLQLILDISMDADNDAIFLSCLKEKQRRLFNENGDIEE